jgi:predicted nuclease of restriction endonuclease-like RecB superfamily
MLVSWEQHYYIAFENNVWSHSVNKASHHLKNVSFAKGVPDFEKTENTHTIIVLDNFMDSDYSTKMSQLFTKWSLHRDITLVLITHNLFHQDPSLRDISSNSKYIVVFKNPRGMTQIVHLARLVYTENISSYHKMFLDCVKIRTLMYSCTCHNRKTIICE